jgi:6-phosphofructokinase
LERFLKEGRRVRGQTPDQLRTAGLKIISKVLEDRIRRELRPTEYWDHFRVITNEPRHLIRSIPPSVTDVIFGERLGALAVDNAMAGYSDFMVSQWLTEFVLVPLPLVVLGRKRVPTNGIFWKSVLSKTEQPTRPPAKKCTP